MGIFSLTKEIAIDLGTANTIIIHNDKIVIDEPSIVAIETRTGKLIAVGKEAQQMRGKEPSGIQTIRPLRKGVIADFNAAEMMIRGLVEKASSKSRWFSPSMRMVVGIPSGSTEVEIRAVRDSSEHAGGRDVYMIYEPMAAALGIGIDVVAPEGNMIVDIGGGTTEIAVISLGGIVSNKSIQIAGDDLTEDIREHMRRVHNVRVGERTAEEMKKRIGCVFPKDEEEIMDVKGRCLLTGLPKVVAVSSTEMMDAFEEPVERIMEAIHSVLERTPPELVADISTNGIVMTGGGSLVSGFDKLVTARTGIHTMIADEAISCVALGTGMSLETLSNMQEGTMNLSRRKQMS